MAKFKKAVTFSFDDAVTQDIRFIEILNKYGLKGTFNLNSGYLGQKGELIREGVRVDHIKVNHEDLRSVYDGHEIAAHTVTHPTLTQVQDDDVIIREVNEDVYKLSELAGYDVVGMAYPGGGVNCDRRVADIIKNNCKEIKYARSTVLTRNYDLQDDLLLFNPSMHMMNFDELFKMGEEFINLKTDEPKIFYVWGHTYEFDIHNTWGRVEEFCKMISGKKDIFYGTNKEVLL